ncbi:MinD/ParA family protein [Desulfolutivibrio sulfoxidireducens]|uniref:MinD/ParA family protein n=1 Tax=Desulfolutivibrio sulfoxidireducens TaxID=2773299 RepID=UPI00159D742E|nr:MinD/ParA family protein [Desulfolutivibrio sulfoxidireducens]QLA16713.1 P-loop NTPase [Desulfolutivibrio sulfoxidireducens]
MNTTEKNPNATLSVSILSGKGGVGKTNLALNLGFALFRAGHRLLVMDFDVGLANIDVLLGLSPEKNLQDLFRPGVVAEDVVLSIEAGGFDFLPAASGVPELLEMDEDMREALFSKLNDVFSRYDYLFLDHGAGISPNVLSAASMSRMPILVVTPEPTSLTDGYAVIKVLSAQYKVRNFHILVNQVASPREAETTFERLASACERFLRLSPSFLGGVHTDPAVPEAVRRQIPLMKFAPKCRAAQDILNIAVKIHRHRQKLGQKLKTGPILKNLLERAS